MDRLKGKVALITGSASGIGRATAKLMAKEGAQVIISDINVPGGREVAAEIKKERGKAIFIKLDVTIERDWIKAVDRFVEKYGKLDVLVNNAGNTVIKSIEDFSLEDYRYLFDLLVMGPFLGTKYAFKTM